MRPANTPSSNRARHFVVGLAVSMTLLPAAVFAEDEISKLAERLIAIRGEVETLHDEIETKNQEHKSRMSALGQRRAELEAQIQRQELELERLERAIAEQKKQVQTVDEGTAAVRPAVEEIAKDIIAHIDRGLPFTVDERRSEVDDVRNQLDRGTLSTPRAVNQLWTLIEDELRLTRENGLFRQVIVVDGAEQLADVIRLGMTMLYFRTGQGQYGYAEPQEGKWAYRVLSGEAQKRTAQLFDSFERQLRTGYFEIALPPIRGEDK